MYLQKLQLTNFRNFTHQTISWHPQFNFIFGKNAQGKTNLLEAIHWLGFLKSFRTNEKKEVILKSQAEACVSALLFKKDLDYKIDLKIGSSKRILEVNNKSLGSPMNYWGLVPILLFEPRDVYLFRDSPSARRRLINKALFLEEATILKTQMDYEKVVLHKNKILKDPLWHQEQENLEVWNEQLVLLGARIIKKRLDWIEYINQLLPLSYCQLSGETKELKLIYKTSLWDQPVFSKDYSLEDIQECLKKQIQNRRTEELRRRESVVGPHRDDWGALLGESPLDSWGSQGENRTAVIALKAAQVELFKASHGYYPLFLLDDVISELDAPRRMALLRSLKQNHGQVFLTTTDFHLKDDDLSRQATSFVVEAGCLRMLETKTSL